MTKYFIGVKNENEAKVLGSVNAPNKTKAVEFAMGMFYNSKSIRAGIDSIWVGTKKYAQDLQNKYLEPKVEEPEVKEEPKAEVKVVVEKEKKNKEKKNTYISIQEITKMYEEFGIKCYNPNAKGNYRIMGNSKGSSLNIKPTKVYFIYSTQDDYELLEGSSLECDDLIMEGKTNSQDKSRPYTVICTAVETLKVLLGIYATNPLNQITE